MEDKRYRRTMQLPLALSGGFNGGMQPPGGRSRGAGATSSPKPSLTETFNKAAKKPVLSSVVQQPVSKMQIEDLRRKMSQPRPTCDFCPLGRVNVARNPQKDRRLLETMTAMTEQLANNKGLSQKFALAEKKGQLKLDFNNSSLGKGR